MCWTETQYIFVPAQRCQAMAAVARQPEVKRALKELAAKFEEIAREMEEGKADRSGPGGSVLNDLNSDG